MIQTIEFQELSAILLDFVDNREGFLYLRMVGAEATVNAIWARLSARETRGKKWGGSVCIPIAGRSHPEYVAAIKGITYKTLRTRLPGEMVDLALIHPWLTVAEDTERGFFLLTYEEGIPAGFFERLNRCLSIPLKPGWTTWLWQQGQQPQSFLAVETKKVMEDGQHVDKPQVVETTQIPITRLQSRGAVGCYSVRCQGWYKDAWLRIIRQQLGLKISLQQVIQANGDRCYGNDTWMVTPLAEGGFGLQQNQEQVLTAPTLKHLLAEARQSLGVNLVLKEDV